MAHCRNTLVKSKAEDRPGVSPNYSPHMIRGGCNASAVQEYLNPVIFPVIHFTSFISCFLNVISN